MKLFPIFIATILFFAKTLQGCGLGSVQMSKDSNGNGAATCLGFNFQIIGNVCFQNCTYTSIHYPKRGVTHYECCCNAVNFAPVVVHNNNHHQCNLVFRRQKLRKQRNLKK